MSSVGTGCGRCSESMQMDMEFIDLKASLSVNSFSYDTKGIALSNPFVHIM